MEQSCSKLLCAAAEYDVTVLLEIQHYETIIGIVPLCCEAKVSREEIDIVCYTSKRLRDTVSIK